MKIKILVLILALLPVLLAGQKEVQQEQRTFLAYFFQARISERWGAWLDVHQRQTDHFIEKTYQTLGRLGITWYLHDALRITAGYAYVYSFALLGRAAHAEQRLWEQLSFTQRHGRVQMVQWIRMEQRFDNASQISPAHRLRYNYLIQVPFWNSATGSTTLSLVANNELFINLGRYVKYNVFDQNRFFAGIAYQLNKSNTLQLGYMTIFQQTPRGDLYYHSNCLRLFYLHNFDFRTPEN